MARMVPSVLDDSHGSYGEVKVFESLKRLPDDYVVFHSLRWNKRNERSAIEWGESDFTVLHKDKGMLVIEVKSGGVGCSDGRWSYIRTDNGEKFKMKNPLEQACRSKYRFADEIREALGDDGPWYCWVDAAVWFPSISSGGVAGSLPIEYHRENTFYESALDNPKRFIDEAYDFYDTTRRTNLDADSFEKLVKLFAPMFSALPTLRSKRLWREEMFVRLTREQSLLLDYLEEQEIAAIQGTAGTGKTMLALEKAKRLAKDDKVLFLCFNRDRVPNVGVKRNLI